MTTNPTTDPISPARPTGVVLSDYTTASIGELLGMCEEFLRTAGPAVHAELRSYLRAQSPPADPSWLIDMLGFNHLHLAAQGDHQASRAGRDVPCPRENWQHLEENQ